MKVIIITNGNDIYCSLNHGLFMQQSEEEIKLADTYFTANYDTSEEYI